MQSEEELYRIIGHNIYKYRKKIGLSRTDLSQKLHGEQNVRILPAEIEDFEQGLSLIEVAQLLAISVVLQTDLNHFVQRTCP